MRIAADNEIYQTPTVSDSFNWQVNFFVGFVRFCPVPLQDHPKLQLLIAMQRPLQGPQRSRVLASAETLSVHYIHRPKCYCYTPFESNWFMRLAEQTENINKSVIKSCQIVVHSTGHQGALSCQRVLHCWLWTARHFLDLNPQTKGHNGSRTTSVQWLCQVQSCHTMSNGTVERTNVKHSNLSNAHGAVKQCKLVEFGKLLCSAASLLFQLHVPGLSQWHPHLHRAPAAEVAAWPGSILVKWLCEIQTVHLSEPSEACCSISFLTLHQPSTSEITFSSSFFGSQDPQSLLTWRHKWPLGPGASPRQSSAVPWSKGSRRPLEDKKKKQRGKAKPPNQVDDSWCTAPTGLVGCFSGLLLCWYLNLIQNTVGTVCIPPGLPHVSA